MSSVKIHLNNYNNYCVPGQTLTGIVKCVLTQTTKLRSVKVKFYGYAKTEWDESKQIYDKETKEFKTTIDRHFGENVYFNADYTLLQGGNNFSLCSGHHSYDFSFNLPPILPSSFKGQYGTVCYSIEATLDRPEQANYTDKLILKLASPLDLNKLPGLKEPTAQSVNKTTCSCWCNDSGALTFNMSLPATGFAANQVVNIGVHIENMTNVNVDSVKFKIVADREYIVHKPHRKAKSDQITIVECEETGIGAHGDKSWTSALKIPSNIPNLIPCDIINISYRLIGEAVLPFPHMDLDNEVAIMLGSIPLRGITTSVSFNPPPQVQTNNRDYTLPQRVEAGFVHSNDPSAPFAAASFQGTLHQVDYGFGMLDLEVTMGFIGNFLVPPSYEDAKLMREAVK